MIVKTQPQISKLIENDKGVSLIEHSKLVSMFAVEIANITLAEPDKDIIKNIEFSGLLHNIGKCCSVFQKEIKTKPKKSKNKYLYNEIGWAFATKYISARSEFILDCIYWTNGIQNRTLSEYNNDNVLDTISEDDKDTMLEFMKEVLPPTNIYLASSLKINAPTYYSGDSKDITINAEKTFVRTCVISANSIVSSLEINKFKELLYSNDGFEIRRIITDLTKRKYYNHPSFKLNFDGYNPERLNIQKRIAELCENTTVVNAPAGFGKSLLSVLWNLIHSSKKMIIVCPTNVISESTYLNILKELKTLGVDDKVSMELYLTGETKKTNGVDKESFVEFNSDIIVTNIDNFLSPSINNLNAGRLFFINSCDVVFDEYHKLVCKEALIACFINIMNVRHRFTNSKTLLVSATPVKINTLWDTLSKKTKFLPEENGHYPASHKQKYKINTLTVDTIDDIKVKSKSSSVVILNSISNAQLVHKRIGSKKLAHSNFSHEDKEIIFSHLYKSFDKNSSRSLNKENITATHVIQESLDISFANIHESVLSPSTSMQRMGRCDRFGDYGITPQINIYKIINGGGEAKIKQILYTTELSDKWFDYLSKFNGKTHNLDGWYGIYNEFNRINSKEIDKYIESCFEKGMRFFSRIFPRKYAISTQEKNMVAGANKLRSTGSEIFFICKINGTDKYSEVFTDGNYNNFKGYNEDEKTVSRIIKAISVISKKADDRFDYKNLLKQWDISVFRRCAVYSDTPYIRFDVVYHPEYGVIKKVILNKM